MRKQIISASVFIAITLPVIVLAEVGKIENPLKGGDSIDTIFINILNFIEYAGAFVSTFAFVYGGFLYVKARGNEKGIGEAHEFMKGTIIGTLILLSATIIGEVIQKTIHNLIS